ncbi:MAG TPA: glycosyl hydrolase 115 family protein [Terracidiphilus sp.]|nr:glycosyl hydrolase 115 family protein [Terracidiphilus sp.]
MSKRIFGARRVNLPSLSAAILVSAAFPSIAWSQNSTVTIQSSVTLVESAQESGPVKRATEDLRNDFNKVFGQAPRLVNNLADAGPVAILIAQRDHVPADLPCTTTDKTEAFAFSITGAGVGPTHRRVVCLIGADMRGTIYAIYQFSQTVLGVDPMYLWTDKQPEKRTSVRLSENFSHVFPSPVFRYRGFFPNDEDLLTGWIPAKKGEHTGISLKVWDNIFETILRLKGNIVVPGTWIFPDDAQVQAASERGLIVNQHHAIPLGVNVARWPYGVPYNYSTHPEILRRAWTDAVATYKPGEEILWSVGLRGLSDSSYASLDPSVRNNDPLLGKRISDAITDQMQIVRARYPDAHFVTDLWQEGARLMREGYLKIPPEVALVWADTGYGDMQDGGDVAAGQGMYIHTAMMNGNANQLSEMVPVSVIQEELGRYIKAGATAYVLINTSDIRPVTMTTEEVMNIAWGGEPKESSDADGAYYRQWATEEFGPKSAASLEKIYKEYFAAPAPRREFRFPRGLTSAGNAPPRPENFSKVPREDGDQHYHSEARRWILDTLSEHQVIAIPSQSPKWTQPRVFPSFDEAYRRQALQDDVEDCAAAQPRWDKVWQDAVAAEPLVDPARRDYYQAEVLTMITINRESNRMLLDVARSLQDNDAGDTAKAETEASEALAALDAIQKSMAAAEYGKWKNWYRGDWLTGVYRTRELVQDYYNHLKDPMAKLPAPANWSGWEAYFHIMEYEDDRSVDVK